MFGMGVPEIMLILAIALIVIGPKKLPELAKSLGRALNEFKSATSELKGSFELDNDMKEVKKSFEDVEQELKKPIDVNPEEKDADLTGGLSEKEVDGETDTDDGMKQVYSPEKQTEQVSSSDKEQADDEMPATDIPAELLDQEPVEESSKQPEEPGKPEKKAEFRMSSFKKI